MDRRFPGGGPNGASEVTVRKRYYQDELAYLREEGAEFAKAHPSLAWALAGPGPSKDPETERLLEGFAFLTGRLREKLDDEVPEITHALVSLLWPQYLRPIPSMVIQEFRPLALRGSLRLPRGSEVESVPVEGTRCRFRTAFDVDLVPLSVVEAILEPSGPHRSRLRLKLQGGADPVAASGVSRLRFYLHGEGDLPATLLSWLLRRVVSVRVENGAGRGAKLPQDSLQAVGFAQNEALLPYPPQAFDGYRLLQEYFALPEKFHFVDVTGLGPALISLEDTTGFDLLVEFDGRLELPRKVTASSFRLGCTPAVNLFPHPADPVVVDQTRTEYRVWPGRTGKDPLHFEIFSVETVSGAVRGRPERRLFVPWTEAISKGGVLSRPWYRAQVRPGADGSSPETWLSVGAGRSEALSEEELLSIDLLCTNRALTERLVAGDIRLAGSRSPSHVAMTNLTAPTAPVSPPLGRGLYFRLIGHLSLAHRSLGSVEALRTLLTLYNFHALAQEQAARVHQMRMESLLEVRAIPMDWMMMGRPVRGSRVEVDVREGGFGGPGATFVFGTVLDRFLAQWVSLNSFSRLVVRDLSRGDTLTWPPRLGDRCLV